MAPSQRLIRRRPFGERVKAFLNPFEFLLWLLDELSSNDWDQWQRDWGTTIGLGLNLVMLVARANSRARKSSLDDVFGDDELSFGLLSWLVCS